MNPADRNQVVLILKQKQILFVQRIAGIAGALLLGDDQRGDIQRILD